MKFIYTFLLLIVLCVNAVAQDVHLTQYYTSNLSLNPAYTGNFEGDIKVGLNSRTQWAQVSPAMKTNMVSIEKKFLKRPNEFGLGAIIINDQVSSYFLHTNKILLSGSYQKNYKGHLIRFGLQSGIVMRNINTNDQTFPSQWDYQLGGYDPSANNNEGTLKNSWSYLNVNAGVAWTHLFGKVKLTGGYALFNLNKPVEGYGSATKAVPFRHVLNASAVYYMTPTIHLLPHLLYMNSATATDFLFGVNATKKVTDNLGFLVGAGYRGSTQNSDAAIAVAGINYNRFAFGFSWDFNVSSLSKDARNKSAWELSLTYITPSRASNKVTLPCDRY
ncbi:PorP/SprF family type IX secretion system membrane protein [Cytophaga aurantiaca]|uniref:PorP/SprF family type IX secretion system membrane protein n=1 Tax=Cytophaga aurantiaca TaxID=29530 RepID=UPI00035DB67E|nr:PorP/SprF family type IX secretion system membrane protein [Cytophaga aurantiaca]